MAAVKLVVLAGLFICVFCNTQEGYKDHELKYSPTQTTGSPWPMPKSMTVGTTQFNVNKEMFLFVLTSGPQDILNDAFVRYRKIIFGADANALKFKSYRTHHRENSVNVGAATLERLTVTVLKNASLLPSLDSDESYSLQIPETGDATLVANEVWGALRGLETFSQIIVQNIYGMYVVNQTSINDEPRFKHRGLLLDTSRHFLSLHVLKQNLDVMAQNKFNVFHWHIVDDQAFPFESNAFPDLSRKGAYTPAHVYSQQSIKEIIEYARLRGIRVIPEFDTPGHSQSWGKALSKLLTPCYSSGKPDGTHGPIDPIRDSTYDTLTKLFQDVSSLFPDHYLHLGGDEVSFKCWQSNPDITAFMQKQGFGTDYGKLEEYYMGKLLKIISDLQKGYMIWQEVIDNGAKVAPDTVVGVWKGGYADELAKVTSLGYKTLLLSPWYVNYIKYGEDWPNYYKVEPLAFNGTAAQKALIMGGETCIWGEFVDDTNLISRLWPRASAIAERLWSPAEVNDFNMAAPRLDEHRCRLVRRGYPAEPINGPGYCLHEYGSGQ